MSKLKFLLAGAAFAALAGCQMSADAERAAIGAAVAGGTAAIVNANVGAAIAVGAAAGALCDDAGICK